MIEKSLLISFIVVFLHTVTRKGHIFGFIYEYTWQWKGWKAYLSKPIFNCPICMSPWRGSLILFLLKYNGGALNWILIIFAAGGISTILLKFMPEFDGYKKGKKKN